MFHGSNANSVELYPQRCPRSHRPGATAVAVVAHAFLGVVKGIARAAMAWVAAAAPQAHLARTLGARDTSVGKGRRTVGSSEVGDAARKGMLRLKLKVLIMPASPICRRASGRRTLH